MYSIISSILHLASFQIFQIFDNVIFFITFEKTNDYPILNIENIKFLDLLIEFETIAKKNLIHNCIKL